MREFFLKAILIIFMSVATVSAYATVHGEKTVGLRAGYSTNSSNPAAGIYFQYAFSRHFRIAPNVDYLFRNKGVDGFHFNINAHFPIGLKSSRFDVYPLIGLGAVSMSAHNQNNDSGSYDDVTTRSTKFGLNIGGGAEFMATSALKLFVEGKFNWIEDFNSGVFCIGIGYVF